MFCLFCASPSVLFFHYSGIYSFVHELVADYVKSFGAVQVTMGTIYDYNDDGLWEAITNDTK